MVKTTLELPDQLYRQIKAMAATSGRTVKEVVTDSLRMQLAAESNNRGWRAVFGKAKKKEVLDVQAVVDSEFSSINEADWK